MGIAAIRHQVGLSQSEFARRFDIPVRTLQQWEQGKSSPPQYVLSMIKKLLPYVFGTLAEQDQARFAIPERDRWKVCIDRPFQNCDRIYPIQQRKVRALLDDLMRDKNVERVVVFGSSTTERCHQGSDVDIYVETADEKAPLIKPHDFSFDLWTNHAVDARLREEIERTGVTVYGE